MNKNFTIYAAIPIICLLNINCEKAKSISQPITDFMVKPVVLPCPDYRILADASKLEKFKPKSLQSLIDVEFNGRITNMALTCKSKIQKKTKTGFLDVEISLKFKLSRGPVRNIKAYSFRYFIGVTDQNYKILYREGFQTKFNFKNNAPSIVFASNPITIELPILKGMSNKNYIIFSGFETTREQLKQNRIYKTLN